MLDQSIVEQEMMRCVKPLGVALLLSGCADGATAQTLKPDKQIVLVVGAERGSSTDKVARALATELTKSLGQAVVVENSPGGAGSQAVAKVTGKAEDSLNLLLAGSEVLLPSTRGKLQPVAPIATVPTVVVGKTGMTWDALKRQSTSTLDAGPDLSSVMLAGQLKLQNSKRSTARSGVAGIDDVLSGKSDAIVVPYPVAKDQILAGKLRILGADAESTGPVLPGWSGTAADSAFLGLFAPKNGSPDQVNALGTAVKDALASTTVRKVFEAVGVIPSTWKSKDFDRNVEVQYSIVANACKVKATCDASPTCPRPCPAP